MVNIDDLKKEIASLLGEEWTISDKETLADRYDIVLKDDPQCGFYVSYSFETKPKLFIGGLWRVSETGLWGLERDESSFSIRISAKKSTISIATDIKRRFLPVYLEAYQRNVIATDIENVRIIKKKANTKRIKDKILLYQESALYSERCAIEISNIGSEEVGVEFAGMRIELAEEVIKFLIDKNRHA